MDLETSFCRAVIGQRLHCRIVLASACVRVSGIRLCTRRVVTVRGCECRGEGDEGGGSVVEIPAVIQVELEDSLSFA